MARPLCPSDISPAERGQPGRPSPPGIPLRSLRSASPFAGRKGTVSPPRHSGAKRQSAPFVGRKGRERSERGMRGAEGWRVGEVAARPHPTPRAYPAHIASLVRAPFVLRTFPPRSGGNPKHYPPDVCSVSGGNPAAPPRAYPCVRFAPRPLSLGERGLWWALREIGC